MDPADADRRVAAQGEDLVTRLDVLLPRTVRRRVLPTEGSLEEVRQAVSEALAKVISAR
jgi:hypothetical protein